MPVGAFVTDGGLDQVAHRLDVAAREEAAREEAERKEANRVAALTAQATAKNRLADLQDELVTGLNDGTLQKTELQQAHSERAGKVLEESIKGVAPEHQALVRAQLEDDLGRFSRDIRRVVADRNRQDIGAGIVGYLEEQQRWAGRGEAQRQEAMQNVEAFLQSAGPQAGMKPQDIAKQAQAFKEGVTFNWLDSAISKNATSGKGLSQIQQDIAADKFPELDPAKRTFLENKIMARQQHLAQQAEIADRRRMTQLERGEKRLSWYVENGMDIPPQELAAFDKASKGTPFDGATQMILAEQKSVAELARLSPNDMVAKFNELKTSYGATPSKEQAIHLAKVGKYVDNSIKLLRESPLTYATQREGAVVTPLDLSKPQEWQSNLSARTGILLEQSKRNGTEPKGLFPQEAAQVSAFLQTASDKDAAQMLATLRKGFGDDKVFRATMQQIAKDSPVTSLAGTIATREAPMRTGGFLGMGGDAFTPQSTASLMLSGERLLNKTAGDKAQDGKSKGFPMPKDDEMRRIFNTSTQGAFGDNYDAYDIQFQAARAIYAGLTKGEPAPDLNSAKWKEAIQRSTGGITNLNGNGNVIKPWGMDDGQFKDLAHRGFVEAVRSAGLPADVSAQWSRFALENTKGGYLVKSGTGYLTDRAGNPVIVRINEPQQTRDAAGRRLVDLIPR